MADSAVFALSVLALLAIPGPTNTLLAGSGATRGVLRSLPLLVGELAGYNIAITAMRQALGTVIAETSGAQVLLKFAITAYLVFLQYGFGGSHLAIGVRPLLFVACS